MKRLLFIHNLRWLMIILVISMHAADTYSPLGNWYFTDKPKLNRPTLLVFAAWQMFLQSFFMGLLFFIAGFFVRVPWRVGMRWGILSLAAGFTAWIAILFAGLRRRSVPATPVL